MQTNRPATPLIERACWSPSRKQPRRHGPIGRQAHPRMPRRHSLGPSERRNRLQIMCIVWMFRTTTSSVYPAWFTKLILERRRAPARASKTFGGLCLFSIPLQNAPGVTQRRPPVRFDSRGRRRAYSHHSPGLSSGSGGARLGLSQKGDLPGFGERRAFWSKVADARIY